ncbi:MAG: 50S ribosomal protein L13 [Deltaproteobacteria bacterium RIFOXYA12_FULL_61_11]|nr:MAG: 50S ribosomal protein L13 [Deltaproteobacteria bacterium RIFOXYA12_FULL_61_11]
MKTLYVKTDDVERKWYLIDAQGKRLGRLASQVARILRGKNKPIFAPDHDTGDFVVVINAGKIEVTGTKLDTKKYYQHSRYPGGLKATLLKVMLAKSPEYVITHAVKGMLPKNHLGRVQLKKLKVYPGGDHPHTAQQPTVLTLQ